MITKMKKLTLLVYHKEYEDFLEGIRELGVVHIVEKQRGEMDSFKSVFDIRVCWGRCILKLRNSLTRMCILK